MQRLSKRKLPLWKVAIFSMILSAIGGLSSGQSNKKERRLYTKKFKQAPWAPPAWVFAPAWTTNNFFLLLALRKLLASSPEKRKKLLFLQIPIWVIFFSFNYVYFNRKSPILGAVWTITDALLALSSLRLAYRTDKEIAQYYLPLAAWTGYASSLAVYQALKNPDPFLKLSLYPKYAR